MLGGGGGGGFDGSSYLGRLMLQFLEVILWLLLSDAFIMGSYIPKVLFSLSETLSMWGVLIAGVGDDC